MHLSVNFNQKIVIIATLKATNPVLPAKSRAVKNDRSNLLSNNGFGNALLRLCRVGVPAPLYSFLFFQL